MPLDPLVILQVAPFGGVHASPGLLPEHAAAELHSPERSPQVHAAAGPADDASHAVAITHPTTITLARIRASTRHHGVEPRRLLSRHPAGSKRRTARRPRAAHGHHRGS